MDNKEKSTQEILWREAKQLIDSLTLPERIDYPAVEKINENLDFLFSLANDQQFEIDRLRERIKKLISVLDITADNQFSVLPRVLKLYLETL